MMPATLKKMSNYALIIGLIAHLEDRYKGKNFKKNLAEAKSLTNEAINFFPEGLTVKEVKRLEKRILRLDKYLNNKPSPVYTSVALGIIADMKAFLKGEAIAKNADKIEAKLFQAHKYLDQKLDKHDCYYDASKALAACEGL